MRYEVNATGSGSASRATRTTALAVHVLLGLYWLLILWIACVDLGGTRAAIVWVASAAVLWLLFGNWVWSGNRPWRTALLWWGSSLVAPLSLILVATRAWRPSAQEVDMAPDSTVLARLDEAEVRLRGLEREVANLRRLVSATGAPVSAPAPARTAAPRPPVAPPAPRPIVRERARVQQVG